MKLKVSYGRQIFATGCYRDNPILHFPGLQGLYVHMRKSSRLLWRELTSVYNAEAKSWLSVCIIFPLPIYAKEICFAHYDRGHFWKAYFVERRMLTGYVHGYNISIIHLNLQFHAEYLEVVQLSLGGTLCFMPELHHSFYLWHCMNDWRHETSWDVSH